MSPALIQNFNFKFSHYLWTILLAHVKVYYFWSTKVEENNWCNNDRKELVSMWNMFNSLIHCFSLVKNDQPDLEINIPEILLLFGDHFQIAVILLNNMFSKITAD